MIEYAFNALPLVLVIYMLISGRLMVNPSGPKWTILTPVRRFITWVKWRRGRKRMAAELQEMLDG